MINILFTSACIFLAKIAAFFSAPAVAKLLGIVEYGNYSFLLGSLSLIMIFASGSLSSVVAKYISVAVAEKLVSPHLLMHFFIKAGLLFSILTCVTLYFVKFTFHGLYLKIFDKIDVYLSLICFIVAAMSLVGVLDGVIAGLNLVIERSISQVVQPVVFLIGIFLFSSNKFTVLEAVNLFFLSILAQLTYQIAVLLINNESLCRRGLNKINVKWRVIFSDVSPIFLNSIFVIGVNWLIIWYISNFSSNKSDLGGYAALFQLKNALASISLVFIGIYSPRVAKFFVEKNLTAIKKYNKIVNFCMFGVFAFLMLVVYYVGDSYLKIFGQAFESYSNLIIYYIAQFYFLSTAAHYGSILVMINESKVTSKWIILQTIALVFLIIIFIGYEVKLADVSYFVMVGLLIQNFGLMYEVCKKIELNKELAYFFPLISVFLLVSFVWIFK